jgi:hypothetical protein
MAQSPFGAINGVGGVGPAGGANPVLAMLTGMGLGGTQAPAQAGGVPGGQGDGFNASPELQEENQQQQEEMQKLARIRDLINEIIQLQQQAQQQQQQGDQQGAAQTQQRIQQDMTELNALMGNGQNGQNGQQGGVPPVGGDGGGGGAAPVGGGGPAGGGAPYGGGAPVGGNYGGGGPGGGDGTLNAPVTDGGGPPVDVSSQLQPGGADGIPEKYKDNQMAQLIWQEAKKNGADPRAMLATAVVESGLNPKAVGDNGTSFGLYQYHQGGALGSHDANWAFNPKNIIDDEAKRFANAGVRDGAGAAAVQRPADPVGYAQKVNSVMNSFNQK